MSAQPSRTSTTRATEAQEKREIDTRFRWPTHVVLRAGVLDNPETGERFEVTQASSESQVLVRKTNPTRAFPVLTETSAPLLSTHGDETTASSAEMSIEVGLHRVGGSNVTQAGRLRRRLEEHRVEVEQLRQKIGDPTAALEQFMVDNFDEDAIRNVFFELLEDGENERSSEIDAQEGH